MSETRFSPELRASLAPYERPITAAGISQLITSFGPFIGTCALMYWLQQYSLWAAWALALPAAGFLVRIFIIQHDCGHGSFFRSKLANDIVGWVCGVMTLTPYASWRREHAVHHGNWNNLDRRATGSDIYTTCLTVAEYNALSPWRKLLYRVPRHPLIAHFIVPPLVFLLLYRVPFDIPKSWSRERRGVYLNNLAIAAVIVALGLVVGFGPVLIVQLPVMAIAAILGVWLFAVQHRFDGAEWARKQDWSHIGAALRGSSYLKLPRILQWFSGNIGFHHIHHLTPRIPNYRLADCYRSVAALRESEPLTLWPAFKAVCLNLWDEQQGKLVRFRDAHRAGPQE